MPAEPVPLVSSIVLCYNGQTFLDTCLGSLLAQEPAPEVILVDNGSTDGSVEYAAAHFPSVRIIANGQNLGFAEGNNAGLRAARGEFLFVVNTDTETAPGALRTLVETAQGDPAAGAAAPCMLQFYARDRIDAAGLTVDRAGIGWNRHRGQRDRGEITPYEVFGVSAGAALYRKAMLDQVGFFDPNFFAYYEDVDLAWRARLAGWKSLYVPRAVVYHIHGASFKHDSARRLYLLGRNKWWTILKNYPLPDLALYLPWIIAADVGAVLYALLVRRELHSLRGRMAALRGLGRVLAQRRVIQAQRRTSFGEMARFMRILGD